MFKTKKVRELESAISSMEAKIDRLTAENEKQRKMLNGDRVCSSLCEFCENSVRHWQCLGGYYTYECLLDCKCADFKKKESEEKPNE